MIFMLTVLKCMEAIKVNAKSDAATQMRSRALTCVDCLNRYLSGAALHS